MEKKKYLPVLLNVTGYFITSSLTLLKARLRSAFYFFLISGTFSKLPEAMFDEKIHAVSCKVLHAHIGDYHLMHSFRKGKSWS
jgi:hypothetical protein